MNITPINNSNCNFHGKIITKGTWTQELEQSFRKNIEVNKLAANNKDIIGLMKRKKASKDDPMHYPRQPIYKLIIMSRPEIPTFIDKIKTFFRALPSINVTRSYHSESSMKRLMNERIRFEFFEDDLEID